MTVGGIPSLPSPDDINTTTESNLYFVPSLPQNLIQSHSSKEEKQITNSNKDDVASDPKNNPEYLNLTFEQSAIQSEKNFQGASQPELKMFNKGIVL